MLLDSTAFVFTVRQAGRLFLDFFDPDGEGSTVVQNVRSSSCDDAGHTPEDPSLRSERGEAVSHLKAGLQKCAIRWKVLQLVQRNCGR